MSWTIQKTIPTFAVPDLQAGIDFYTRLGFMVDWKWPELAPTHAGLNRADSTIMLSQCEPAERACIKFIISNVAACHAAVIAARPWELAAAAGALANRADCPPLQALRPPKAPERKPYDFIEFTLIDPWGHELTFSQPV